MKLVAVGPIWRRAWNRISRCMPNTRNAYVSADLRPKLAVGWTSRAGVAL
jgi:hypothetical protein